MNFRYNIDDKLSPGATLLYGLQWLMICIPVVLTSTFVAPEGEMVFFTQKLFALSGLTIIAQVLFGHKMPLVAGPAAVLLMGVIASASQGYDASTIYPSMILGGVLVLAVAVCGAMKYLQRIFTPRVVVSIVVLISFTMTKPIVGLLFSDNEHSLMAFVMAIGGVIVMAWANKILRGIWKSMVVIVAMILGAVIYYAVAGFPTSFVKDSVEPQLVLKGMNLDAGVVISFIFCYVALLINQVGSVQSFGDMLGVGGMDRRQTRSLIVTGLSNMIGGATGVLGMVDYSLSPGVVASTSCASRYTMLPAAVAMVLISLFPQLVSVLLTIPQPVMGAVLLYLMATQVAAGFHLMQTTNAVTSFQEGLVLGTPIIITIILSFMPQEATTIIPQIIRPIVGNGFVMGIIVVMVLEHIVLREKSKQR